mmetsp:Transcript_44812/g.130518  ORF Transcript_44812/g.130518 Transcript_44812/m.130518 type:complete len:265 (+) Transcript_44812:331-1125(+)
MHRVNHERGLAEQKLAAGLELRIDRLRPAQDVEDVDDVLAVSRIGDGAVVAARVEDVHVQRIRLFVVPEHMGRCRGQLLQVRGLLGVVVVHVGEERGPNEVEAEDPLQARPSAALVLFGVVEDHLNAAGNVERQLGDAEQLVEVVALVDTGVVNPVIVVELVLAEHGAQATVAVVAQRLALFVVDRVRERLRWVHARPRPTVRKHRHAHDAPFRPALGGRALHFAILIHLLHPLLEEFLGVEDVQVVVGILWDPPEMAEGAPPN